jgi:hypothetical protein
MAQFNFFQLGLDKKSTWFFTTHHIIYFVTLLIFSDVLRIYENTYARYLDRGYPQRHPTNFFYNVDYLSRGRHLQTT